MKTEFPPFPPYACANDSIEWTNHGFDFEAVIVYDTDTRPDDSECYDERQIRLWKSDQWFFCGVVLSVSFKGVKLSDHAASLWGIECNLSNDNSYLSEVAQELEGEALEVAKNELTRIRKILEVQA